jgi:thymidylate synthase
MTKSEGDPDMIWNQDQFIHLIKTDDEFAREWGELGSIYGRQWRGWADYYNGSGEYTDQIQNLINDIKTNPDSRRLLVSAWNVAELDQMVLPPCHYSFQVYTRELSLEERYVLYFKKLDPTMVPLELQVPNIQEYFDNLNVPKRAISLMWNQRSVDTFLGLPFNIASYGLLLEIIAKVVNMVPDELIGNLGDTHLYLNHIEQAKEQINRESFELPTLNINTEFWQTESGECGVGPLNTNLQGFEINDFQLENYQSHPSIKAPLSN